MSVSRRKLLGKLNSTLFKALESGTVFCKLRGNAYVEIIHWFHQLWQLADSDIHRIVRHYEIDPADLQRDMTQALSILPTGAGSISDFSHHIELAVERAWVIATVEYGKPCIRSAWLLEAMLKTVELRRVLLSISKLFQKIKVEEFGDLLSTMIVGSIEDHESSQDGLGLDDALPGEASGALPEQQDNKSPLEKYCTDLTRKAKSGDIDPVVGRSHEIRTMIDILLRRRQNNPLLTGEAGVGKTAVVEGLAIAIAKGEVPPALTSVRLLSLDVGGLLAGASMRGEFESRLKGLLEDASRSPVPIILFVDEIHTLVGAGGQAGTGDAANLLKPALARGGLRTIGATTWTEYKKHIEKDPALTRRFQVLQVMEPEEAVAVEMVRGLVPIFRKHHGVDVLDEAVISAVKLSHRYIPARQLPDKAISLLDTACARVAMSLHAVPATVEFLRQRIEGLRLELTLLQEESSIGKGSDTRFQQVSKLLKEQEINLVEAEKNWQEEKVKTEQILLLREKIKDGDLTVGDDLKSAEKNLSDYQGDLGLIYTEVDSDVVAEIVSNWTGIPVGRMVKDEIQSVLKLANRMKERVVGQDKGLEQICERVQTAKAGMTDPNKPVGVFLLVGPSGVGKTETALTLAENLFGGEQNLITINMSEYQEAHTVSSLKGSPPGYVGYGEGGVLTEAVRRKPYSVILLDEVEKAHPDVHELFYQVFDKGWMEDGEGRQIDFKNTLILLTSNTGSELIEQLCEDEVLAPSPEKIKEALQSELRKVFPAAFIGRTTVVPYVSLSDQVMADIARIQLDRVVSRMSEQHDIQVIFDLSVEQLIVKECTKHETGARRVLQFIEQNILPELSRRWLESMGQELSIKTIQCTVGDSSISDVRKMLVFEVS
jgi:type VI secretion system protein VasG